MKKLMLAGSFLTLMAASSFGATLCTAVGGTGSATINSNGVNFGGGDNFAICGDKRFDNFTLSSGTGQLTITEVTADSYSLIFSPSGNSATSAFTLGFSVGVVAPSTDRIFQIAENIASNTTQPNAGTVVVTHTPTGVVGGTGVPPSTNTVSLSFAAGGGTNGFINYAGGVTNATASATFTPNGTSLKSVEFTVIEIPPSTVPEPMTLSLVGGGLIALGAISRRKKRA